MIDNQWLTDVSDYYRDLAIGDGPRETIVFMRDTALQTQKWRRAAGVFAVAGVLILAWGASSAHYLSQVRRNHEVAIAIDAPRYDLMAVRIHRDQCGKCQQMGNVFAELQRDLNGRQILFVTFDLTDPVTTKQSQLLVDALEVRDHLEGIGTGNIVLLAPDGQFLERLDGTAGREYLANQIAMRL